jgi:UDP-glucose 4-epimerase
MRFIVTGPDGFIARNFTRFAERWGHDVEGLPYEAEPGQAPDAVILLGAVSGIASCEDDPLTVEKNVTDVLDWAEYCRKRNVRLVFASSCAVARNPHAHLYGWSKWAAEGVIQTIHPENSVILRFTNVFGPYSAHKQSVVHKFIRQALSGEEMTVHGTGTQVRDFVPVDKVVSALMKAACDKISIGPHVVSSGVETEIGDLACRIRSIVDGAPRYDDELDKALFRTAEWYKNRF